MKLVENQQSIPLTKCEMWATIQRCGYLWIYPALFHADSFDGIKLLNAQVGPHKDSSKRLLCVISFLLPVFVHIVFCVITCGRFSVLCTLIILYVISYDRFFCLFYVSIAATHIVDAVIYTPLNIQIFKVDFSVFSAVLLSPEPRPLNLHTSWKWSVTSWKILSDIIQVLQMFPCKRKVNWVVTDRSFCIFQREIVAEILFSWNWALYPYIIHFSSPHLFPLNVFSNSRLLCLKFLLKMSPWGFLPYITVRLTLIHTIRQQSYKKTLWPLWPPAAAVSRFSQIPWLAQSTRGINSMQQLPEQFVQHRHVDRKDLVMLNLMENTQSFLTVRSLRSCTQIILLVSTNFETNSINATTSPTEQSCFCCTVAHLTWWLFLNYNLTADGFCVPTKEHMRI